MLESADLNQMLRHIYVVNNAGSIARGLKFGKVCGEKRPGLILKSRHFAIDEGIFLFPLFLSKKLIFENI